MTLPRLDIDPDVARATTLPAEVYRDPAWFAAQAQRVFARSWSLVAEARRLGEEGALLPLDLLPGCVGEPLLLARDAAGDVRCLSNVCTHRGNLLVDPGEDIPPRAPSIRCRYHGRRFALDGRILSMPRFDGVVGFPSPADDLPRVPLETWAQWLFVSLTPAIPFADWIAPVRDRAGWIDFDRLRPAPAACRSYDVAANWALYVDNYLEGFHVPFVHPGLDSALEPGTYRTEILPHAVLQTADASPGDPALCAPQGHLDHGRRLAAYYFWLFPTTMVNVYPWGLSINVVTPLAPDRTRVSFLSYVGDESLRVGGAGADLHGVEMEDERIVERVQRGIASRLYRCGRYSTSEETGVHHFHRLLAAQLNGTSL